MQFDYFYPEQADQYPFYRIPKIFFSNKELQKLSAESKILYGLMLDRVSLSVKNGWIDKKRRVYIIFYVKNFNSGVPPNERFKNRQNNDELKLMKIILILIILILSYLPNRRERKRIVCLNGNKCINILGNN